jgi:hypothetical protein
MKGTTRLQPRANDATAKPALSALRERERFFIQLLKHHLPHPEGQEEVQIDDKNRSKFVGSLSQITRKDKASLFVSDAGPAEGLPEGVVVLSAEGLDLLVLPPDVDAVGQ